MNTANEFEALSSLLGTVSQDATAATGSAFLHPGQIGPAKSAAKQSASKTKSSDIWDEAEIEDEIEDQDPRPQPHYSLTHVQNVSSEDMYLGMSGKTPSFSHADQFLLKVELPNTRFADIVLDVKAKAVTFVKALSNASKLKVYPEQQINDKQATAKWIKDKSVLEVLLPISRDFAWRQ
ncbi:Protein pih1d3 [Kappamyces sp. JEL0829]|nr:Protein pih1d3 [Kappamyces sp. JEL0829]